MKTHSPNQPKHSPTPPLEIDGVGYRRPHGGGAGGQACGESVLTLYSGSTVILNVKLSAIARLAALLASHEALLNVLKDNQWSDKSGDVDYSSCSACGEPEWEPHAIGCDIGKALAAASKLVKEMENK